MGPQASKMSPRASKITQNHENLVTQNQENPRKKTSRNGTVAGYARSALDIINRRDLTLRGPGNQVKGVKIRFTDGHLGGVGVIVRN